MVLAIALKRIRIRIPDSNLYRGLLEVFRKHETANELNFCSQKREVCSEEGYLTYQNHVRRGYWAA